MNRRPQRLRDFLRDRERDIRHAVKAIAREADLDAKQVGRKHGGRLKRLATFSVVGCKKKQANNVERVRSADKYDADFFERSIVETFNELDREVGSAACVFTQFRCRMALINLLVVERFDPDASHLVTFANLKDRCKGKDLCGFSPQRPQREILRHLAKLKDIDVPYRAVGIVEVSAARIGGAYTYEPHVHLLVEGPTSAQLATVLPGIEKACSRRIDPVYNLLGLGLYLTKFKEERRSYYRDQKTGNVRSRKNVMSKKSRARVLDWRAQHSLRELIFSYGLRPSANAQFVQADLRQCVETVCGHMRETASSHVKPASRGQQ